MSPEAMAICNKAVAIFRSDDFRDHNHLFLEKFDLADTPGYMDVVTRVIDLNTLSHNLNAGLYSTLGNFFDDAKLIFENAISYHKSREAKWIVDAASVMLVVCEREIAKANREWEQHLIRKDRARGGKTKETKGGPPVTTAQRDDKIPARSHKKGTAKPKKPTVAINGITPATRTVVTPREDKKPKAVSLAKRKKPTATTVKGKIDASPPPQNKIRTASATGKVITRPALPVDGQYKTWKHFGDNGGYNISKTQWTRLCDWVTDLRAQPGVIADHVAFHRLIVQLKTKPDLQSARDGWAEVLPNFNADNFFWATLMLMLCTPLVPDTKIIEIFGPLFQKHTVDEKWVIDIGDKKLSEMLAPLGMHKKSAANILKAAQHMAIPGNKAPRDYRDLLVLDGVGPKIALVTIHETLGQSQGIPCDVHMCRIFKILNWIPSSGEEHKRAGASCSDMLDPDKKNGEQLDYELARAAMEGWFPPSCWAELNQTWAGLGQLLNDDAGRRLMADYVDQATSDFDSPWRVCDQTSFKQILQKYVRTKTK